MKGWVCRLPFLLVRASEFILGSESHDHILLSQICDPHKLEGQVPVFISLRKRVTQLYPQELGSLFVVSYDSQGYDGGGGTKCISMWAYRGPYISSDTAFSDILRIT
jgi:hypothetical protein